MRRDISCIIPVYNGDKYIEECVDSILGQTYPVKEVIVVNDGSEDNTIQLLQQYGDRVTIIDKPHTGLSDTLNHGINLVNSEYIAFLDADDVWMPSKTQVQMEAIEKHEVEMCFCGLEQFLSPEMTVEQKQKIDLRQSEIKGFSKITMIVRKEVFDRTGLFDTTITTGDFIDWFSRAKALKFSHHMVDETLCRRRLHLTNFTRSDKMDASDYAAILRNHLLRKRRNQ